MQLSDHTSEYHDTMAEMLLSNMQDTTMTPNADVGASGLSIDLKQDLEKILATNMYLMMVDGIGWTYALPVPEIEFGPDEIKDTKSLGNNGDGDDKNDNDDRMIVPSDKGHTQIIEALGQRVLDAEHPAKVIHDMQAQLGSIFAEMSPQHHRDFAAVQEQHQEVFRGELILKLAIGA